MLKYVLKRTVLAFCTAFLIVSITFLLIKTLPFAKPEGDNDAKVSYYLDQVSQGYVIQFSEETDGYGELLWKYTDNKGVEYYWYEISAFQQYFAWIGNILQGDWGTSNSVMPNVKVQYIIASKFGVTMRLNLLATFISVPLGISLGVFAALRKNTKTDHVISTGVMVFISVPSFVLITVSMLLFSYTLGWLPTQFPVSSDPLGIRILGYVLPVAMMSFGSIAGYTRFVRAELCEVMSSDYLLLARTKGLTKRQAIIRHALKNAMVPVFPMILAEFIFIYSGSMILERLYGINGLGTLYIDALNAGDYNVLFVNMTIFTTIGLLAGVVLDISYKFIDPRFKIGGKK